MKNYLPHCPGFYFEIRKSIDPTEKERACLYAEIDGQTRLISNQPIAGRYYEDLISDFTELVRHKYGIKPNLHNITLQHLPELLTRGKLPVKV